MLLYAIIMLLAAAVFIYVAAAIYRGRTELIHDYHQTNVTDKAAYGRAFGKAMLLLSLGPLFSGMIALFGDAAPLVFVSLGVLIAGLLAGIVCICFVQKKHNKGIL